MTIQREPETGQPASATTRTVRATSAAGSRARVGTAQSATITAELPAVGGPEGSAIRRAPGVNAVRRQSAPVALRILVWLLALVLLVVTVATIVARVRPDDLAVLRHTVGPATTPSTPATSSTTTPPTFRQVSASATAITYAVPATSYDLVITVSAPTFIEGHSPATSSQWAFARTISPTKPTTISITGSSTLTMFKTPTSVSVQANGKVLGSVAQPKLGVTYTFEPSSASG